jgi:hypothetical protein
LKIVVSKGRWGGIEQKMIRFEVGEKKEKLSSIKVNRQKEEILKRAPLKIRFASLWGKGQRDRTCLPKIKARKFW